MIKTSKKCRNKDLRNKGYNGVIDSDFLKFIDSLHDDLDYIEDKVIGLKRCSYGYRKKL